MTGHKLIYNNDHLISTEGMKNKYLEPELIVSHEFTAPRERVFRAWTDPEQFKEWFRPTDFNIKYYEVDARPGGMYRIHYASPDGTVYPTRGDYLEVASPERLVYEDSWDDDRLDNLKILITVNFNDVGTTTDDEKVTKMSLYSAFTSKEHRDEVMSSGVLEGWKMFMDNLERILQAV